MIRHDDADGFTIVELMIAISVFSLVLLLGTISIINITNMYYKGANDNNTLNIANSIMNTTGQLIKFSSGNIATGSAGSYHSICIGTTRFSFILNKELAVDAQHVLWEDSISNNQPCVPNLSFNNSGKELMGSHMRLLGFDIRQLPQATATTVKDYQINVSVASGPNDLLTQPKAWGSGMIGMTRSCRNITGQRFCSVATLETVATRRMD